MSGLVPNTLFLKELQEEAGHDGEKLAAEAAMREAEAIAPYGDESPHYKDDFVVVEDEDGHPILGNTNWKAHFIEWGTSRGFPAYGILRRAAILAGCRFEEKGKPGSPRA